MFTKEIEKIKELTEKLKNEGDVTEDEADWLYIISFIPWKLRTSFDRKYKKINFPAPYESMKALNDALEGWYYIVLQKAKKKETGNFLSTVFYIGYKTAVISTSNRNPCKKCIWNSAILSEIYTLLAMPFGLKKNVC